MYINKKTFHNTTSLALKGTVNRTFSSITMDRKKRIAKYKIRPQQKLKTKVAFDPSVSHIPNKKAKYSDKNKNNKRKKDTANSNGLSVNPETELLGCSSTEMNGISPIHSPINSVVKHPTPAVTQEISKNCCLCSKMIEKKDLVDCPYCDIRVHKACLIVNDPVWKLKLDFSPWLCERCRKKRCGKCLKECRSDVMYYCLSCEVGLHKSCYDSYYVKPMEHVNNDKFVCIPCLDLAIQINQEEVDSDVDLCTADVVSLSSTKDDTQSERSDSSFAIEGYDNDIPNSLKWNTSDVTEYFKSKLPQEVIDKLTNLNIDGRVIQLLQRSDIVSNMDLKLGHALKLYKQVRILQTQSTYNHMLWE